ncbi:hypothetical protein ACWCQZ_08600 [Streptomyces sp. NPDC002285]
MTSVIPEASTATPDPRAQRHTSVPVLLGKCSGTRGVKATEVWPTGGMLPRYGYEALYYPDQISRADAETEVRAELASKGVHVARFLDEDDTWATDVEDIRRRMLAQWDGFRQLTRTQGTATPATEKFMDEMALILSVSPDPTGTLDAIIDTLARDRVKNQGCRVYTWCGETGPHYDHVSPDATVVDTLGDTVIDARILHLSESGPSISIGQSDFTPEQALTKAAELRRFADKVERLAEQAGATA